MASPFQDPFFQLVADAVHEFPFELAKAALVVIDMQYLDAHPSGWMGRLAREQGKEELLRYRFEAIARTVPNIQRLQATCRSAGIEVVHVRVAFLTNDGRDGVPALTSRGTKTPYYGREAEILEELRPEGDEIVVNKTSSGAFNSSNLDQILRNLGIDHLLITGIVTNGCVELTARDAADRGYWVTLVSDGCSASTPELHANALERMTDGGIIAAKTTEEVLTMISRAAGGR
ncbi:MAG: cysteine hydrolase [Ardenticatenaceae bacterium]|nr:cysteine hydrolase [Ardenticatenaceae bacterium]